MYKYLIVITILIDLLEEAKNSLIRSPTPKVPTPACGTFLYQNIQFIPLSFSPYMRLGF